MTTSNIPQDGPLLPVSPSQTIGPFFHDVAVLTGSAEVMGADTGGERVRIEGRVLDGAGQPVDDALVEIWQPEVAGGGPSAGFARSETAEAGRFSFSAVKPSAPADGSSTERSAAFVLVRIFARGLLRALVTRIYFGDARNVDDPVLRSIDPKRRDTLIAVRDASTDPVTYRFDIHLQGDRETVFFELQHDSR